jgi:HlyD family secretion protein
MRKWITILIILAIVGGGAYFVYTNTPAAAPADAAATVETVALSEGNLVTTIDATGVVRPRQSATLLWGASGTVENVVVEEGLEVEAGQQLASLAQTSLPQSVILAQADLVNAQTALEDLYTNTDNAKTAAMKEIAIYADAVRDAQYQLDNYTVPSDMVDMETMEALDQMKAKLDAASAAFEPYKYKASGDPTRQELKEELDQARSDYNAAVKRLEYEYELEVAQDNLDKARADYDEYAAGPSADDVKAAEARIAAAEATLSQAWIEAPFAGTITNLQPQVGDKVNANTVAFQLDNLATLYVDMEISEIDINLIETGQEASLTFDAIRGAEYQGKVTDISPIGNNVQGVVYFEVTIEMSNPDEAVRPGMTAAVEIIVSKSDQALLAPNQAIRYTDGVQVIYVQDESAPEGYRPVEIRVGNSSQTHSEVIDGELQIGDVVALNPSVLQGDQGDATEEFMQQRQEENRSGMFPGMGGGGQQ